MFIKHESVKKVQYKPIKNIKLHYIELLIFNLLYKTIKIILLSIIDTILNLNYSRYN